jgi:response regulator RpfG family c-di-GMP phosphodiesterase
VIARDLHEKWNGEGYPDGRSGEDIHIYGRIAAVADVFDALGSDRCYKKAWPIEKVLDLFQEERGQHFEPRLVDGLMDNLDKVVAIRDHYADV